MRCNQTSNGGQRPVRGLAAFVAVGLAVFATPAASLNFCPAYQLKEQVAVDLDKPFLSYLLDVKKAAGLNYITLEGDTISLSKRTLGSLIKPPTLADPTIALIRINARKVIVEDQLSISNGSIVISAETVTFTRTGVITLLPNSNSRISIEADHVEFPGDRHRYFDVRTRTRADGSRDRFSDVSNILQITASDVSVGSTKLDAQDVNTKLASFFTLSDIFDFTGKITTLLGASGRAQWISNTKTTQRWPEYSASVWRAAFTMSPFAPALVGSQDKKITGTIRDTLDHYIPLFKEIGTAKSVYDLQAIAAAIVQGAVLNGNGPAWTTSLPLSALLSTLSTYGPVNETCNNNCARATGSETVGYLINILKKSRDETPVNSEVEQLVDGASSRLRESMLQYEAAASRVEEISGSINAQAGLLAQLKDRFAIRQQRLKDYAKDVRRSEQSRQQLIAALATVTSIATTAYTGNPKAGAAAGGVVFAVGNSASGKPPLDSLSAGYQFANAIQGPLTAASGALHDLTDSRREFNKFVKSFTLSNITISQTVEEPVDKPKPGEPTSRTISRSSALNDLGDKSRAFGVSVGALRDIYTKFTPDPSPLSSDIEDDANLKTISADMAAVLSSIKAFTIELDSLQRTTSEQQNKIVDLVERISQLKQLSISNEEARRSMTTFVISALRDELSLFASTLGDVRRLSLVEFGEPVQVESRLLQTVLVLGDAADGFDPAKSLGEKDAISAYISLLERVRDNMQVLALRTAQASDAQFRQYVSRRGTGPIIGYPEQTLVAGDSRTTGGRLVALINQTLKEEFLARSDEKKSRELQARRLQVPFDVRSKVSSDFPIRLVRPAITKVFRSGHIGGDDITFTLEVERYGNLRELRPDNSEDLSCSYVDLRSKDSSPNQYSLSRDFTISDIDQGLTMPRLPDLSFWYLRPGDNMPSTGRTMLITYPPAESDMFVRVRLNRASAWKSAPRIGGFTLKLEVFQ